MQKIIYTIEVELPLDKADQISKVIGAANGYASKAVGVRTTFWNGAPIGGIPIKTNGTPYQRIPRLLNGKPRKLKADGTPDMRGGWNRPAKPVASN